MDLGLSRIESAGWCQFNTNQSPYIESQGARAANWRHSAGAAAVLFENVAAVEVAVLSGSGTPSSNRSCLHSGNAGLKVAW